MMQDIDPKPKRAIVAAVQRPGVSDLEFEASLTELRQLALRRIAARVKQGGHNVPREDVLRRFVRSWTNFVGIYRALADAWSVYDNSQATPLLIEQSP